MITYQHAEVRSLKIFYREAGNKNAPTIVLLHGFPTSSFMFRNLIPLLAKTNHVVAPDYPGFGFSDAPSVKDFECTFDNLAAVIEEFLFKKLGLKKFSIYVQDYGAPIGYRVAAAAPEAIDRIILQNGNAYVVGIGGAFDPMKPFWANRNAETEKPVRGLLTLDTTKFQYLDKVKGLVYITALAPDERESTAEVFTRDTPHPDAPKMVPDEAGYIWMPHDGILKAFAPRASAEEKVRLEAIQRPINVACIQEKAPAPAWRKKPTWFLIAKEDRMIPEKTQRFMAERMNATIKTADSDHTPSLTLPKPVIEIVLEAAQSTLAG
jgi:pimeloyl-ACP methyl ester carboxylesterase